MTPFGERLRALRAARGVTLKEMAAALQVSSAYLSALEHGHRGRPTDGLIHQICGYFGLIWDDAEALNRLAEISHPRVTIDTAGLSPSATRLAHQLARKIGILDEERLAALLSQLEDSPKKPE
ncbi:MULTISPECIES: helix-turn-helix domain-containing protein [Oceanibaculum]|uniref:Putative transcriptional regulator, XRE family protein n=1 Tax=Oceanibaculum indicum P24 TaxID=1207063 RepID=K2JV86_9PROT|nr:MULTISPECIES: helix-turn-helix transcriptional regulator [Oceanibaculum]EKE78482.1 putative transcriptional regulator, XRE family protein [Oceanibaculum indicum P24]MCH2393536.1 helix-turn-helix domain-containing protein [Oceanibaculum sp.]